MDNKTNSSVESSTDPRRRFLRLFGTAAALLPITMVAGCSKEQPAAASSAQTAQPEPQGQPQPEPAPAPQAASESAPAQATEELPELSLDDPTAKALGYRHDASNVDLEKYPQRATAGAADHYCRNCTLFRGSEGDDWGPCTLFPGKRVNANGWCSGYTPKAS